MPTLTPNYNLHQYDRVTDANENFIDYRDDMAGTGASTNVNIIDTQMKANADATSDLAGGGRTTETVIDNATNIASLQNKQVTTITALGVDTYTATATGVTLANGMPFIVDFGTNINTGASTLDVNTTGAVDIKICDPDGNYVALTGEELKGRMMVVYSTTLASYLLLKEPNQNPTFETVEGFASVLDVPSTAHEGPTSDNGGNAVVMTGQSWQNGANMDSANWVALNSTLSDVGENQLRITGNGTSSTAQAFQDIGTPNVDDQAYIHAKFTVNGSACTSAEVHVWTNDGNTLVALDTINNPVAGTEYEIAIPLDFTQSINGTRVYLLHRYADAATSNGKTADYQVNFINKTAQNKESLTDAQLLDICRQGNIDGVQSIENPTILSVNENLFDENKLSLNTGLDPNTGLTGPNTNQHTADFTKIKPSTSYYVSGCTPMAISYYDKSGNYISGAIYSGGLFTTPDTADTVRFSVNNTVTFNQAMLVVGSTAPTEYIPHKSNAITAYGHFGSVPSGAEDKLLFSNSAVYKQEEVKHYTLPTSNIIALITAYTNVDAIVLNKPTDYVGYGVGTNDDAITSNGDIASVIPAGGIDQLSNVGLLITNANVNEWQIIVPKGTYASLAEAQADLAETTIVYELASPRTYQLPLSAVLTLYPNGQVFNYSDTHFGILAIQAPSNEAAVIVGHTYASNANAKKLPNEQWQAPVFKNSFGEYNSLYPVGYRINKDGKLEFKGFVDGGLTVDTVLILPERYRPSTLKVVTVSAVDVAGYRTCTLFIFDTGEVQFRGTVGTEYTSLDDVSISLD